MDSYVVIFSMILIKKGSFLFSYKDTASNGVFIPVVSVANLKNIIYSV